MQRIDGGYLYELGDTIRKAGAIRLRDYPAYEVWAALTSARLKLQEFMQQSVYASSLRTTWPSANRYIEQIDHLVTRIQQERLDTISGQDLMHLSTAYDRFEPVLVSELGSAVTYIVQPKGAYDVAVLVEAGEQMFPESMNLKAPEAAVDLKQGARSLAFELWTAAAFHFHRANEAVLRRYFVDVAGEDKKPRHVTIGTMLSRLKELQLGDIQIIASLDNIKTFHRNPIIHPGANVETLEEALSLVAAIRAAMSYMLDKLPILSLDELMNEGAPAVPSAQIPTLFN